MNFYFSRPLLFFFLVSALCIRPAAAEDYSEAQALVYNSVHVLKNFQADRNLEWFRDNVQHAEGILIVPQMLKGGFVVGGSGGSGILLAHDDKTDSWSYPAFYTITSLTLGLQIGAEASELILLIMTKKGLESMLSTSYTLGADVTIAAGPVGLGAKAATADILAFAKSKGVFGGISIEGAMVSTRNDWNSAYYKQPLIPTDILMDHLVTNPHADELRATLSQHTRPTRRPAVQQVAY